MRAALCLQMYYPCPVGEVKGQTQWQGAYFGPLLSLHLGTAVRYV